MKVIEDQGFCTCCGYYGSYKFGQENFSFIVKNLNNYEKYKNIFVYACKNCGFISTDIAGTEGVLYGEIKDSYEFKELLNFTYLNELHNEFDEDYATSVPFGMYEAYSLVLLEAKDYQKYVRQISMVIDLKEAQKIRYTKYAIEVGANEERLSQLQELMDKSIQTNREQIDHYYSYIENKNIFDDLIYIENMIEMGKLAEAKVLLKSAKDKKHLEEDLLEYFLIKFKQKEA